MRSWLLWPAAAVLASITYLVLPGARSQAAFMVLSSTSTLVALVVFLRRRKPSDVRLWSVFGGGLALGVAGDVLSLRTLLAGTDPGFPAASDAFYVSSYLLLAAGLFGLSRPPGRRSVSGLIDAALVATGIGLVYWVFLVEPILAYPEVTTIVRVALVAYAAATVMEVAVAMPLMFRSTGRSPVLWLLTLFAVCSTAASVGYTLLNGTPLVVVPMSLFPAAYLLMAGAARHAATVRTDADYVPEQFGRGRLALLAASTLLVPVVLTVEGLTGQVSWQAVAVAAVLLFGFMLIRLSGFVTKVESQARQLEDLAMLDELTGLPNRRRFEGQLRDTLPGKPMQLAVLDLNGFKDVNDRLGHSAGDRLLVVVAQRLAEAVRGDDLVARLGGDEFAVVVRDGEHRAMDQVVERLTAALHEPIEVDGQNLLIGASVGTAGTDGTTGPYEVLRRADVAMYAAKAAGGRVHRRWVPAMDDDADAQARIAAELRTALDTGQFRLVYQPVVTLPGGDLVAAEALLRWEHPERGTVAPAAFVPAAESTGMIVELGEWVLRTACAQAAAWRDVPGTPRRISVNVSARQLAEAGFADLVAAVLSGTGLDAAALTIEVTETAVFGGGQAVRTVRALSELGVRIALDDFGTGHSSLGLLETVPVDEIKVDRSFVDNITMAGRHAVIATALIQVADGLGLQAVAEGVETAEQAAELHRLGYRLAQGYHFGRPVPQPDFTAAGAAVPA